MLIVFQAMDAAGKDGTIKHVMSGVNPQGCQVFSFKKPSAEDLDHNFLALDRGACRSGRDWHLQSVLLRGFEMTHRVSQEAWATLEGRTFVPEEC